jgi:hypothetical protein
MQDQLNAAKTTVDVQSNAGLASTLMKLEALWLEDCVEWDADAEAALLQASDIVSQLKVRLDSRWLQECCRLSMHLKYISEGVACCAEEAEASKAF